MPRMGNYVQGTVGHVRFGTYGTYGRPVRFVTVMIINSLSRGIWVTWSFDDNELVVTRDKYRPLSRRFNN